MRIFLYILAALAILHIILTIRKAKKDDVKVIDSFRDKKFQAIFALLLGPVFIILIYCAITSEDNTQQKYIPAKYIDGELIPGRME